MIQSQRWIYLLVFIAVGIPLGYEYAIPPAKMDAADRFYDLIESIDPDAGVAFLSLDFGPNTKAENEAQAEVIIEHLFRRGIPAVLVSLSPEAEGFLHSIPERVANRLMAEREGVELTYGTDWVNLGYRPGKEIFVQSVAKSENIPADLEKDVFGTDLTRLPIFSGVTDLEDITLLAEFTGLVGVFDYYVQFFQKKGYIPPFGHGCTSITIPEAYIYLDSGQLTGLLEGIAGAAWYGHRLGIEHPERSENRANIINTALGVAHLMIIALIIVGNLQGFFRRRSR